MLGKKREKKDNKAESSFLLKLYDILNDNTYKQIIHWSNDGLSIIISDTNALTKKVLPQFYKHHNYASFVRQLNMYNFHKIRGNRKINEQTFIHEDFHKGKTIEEIKEIKRKIKPNEELDEESKTKTKSLSSKKKSNSSIEDKIFLQQVEKIDDDEMKINKYDSLLKKGPLSDLANEKILAYLLEKTKNSFDNQKNFEKEIKELTNQNNNLLAQLQMCNTKLISQTEFCRKMKGLVIFLVTLFMRKKKTSYKICRVDINGGGTRENNGDKKLIDFINKYLDYHNKNKKIINSNNNLEKIINNGNNTNTINTNNPIKSIVQKSEGFTIKQDFSQEEGLHNLENNLSQKNNYIESANEFDLSNVSGKNLDIKSRNNQQSSMLFQNSMNNSLLNPYGALNMPRFGSFNLSNLNNSNNSGSLL